MTTAADTLPVGYRATRAARLTADAARSFAEHEIRWIEGDRRWTIQRRVPSGWTSIFAAEIIVLWGGSILVHGDIEHVIWSSYSDSAAPRRTLRWMGDHDSVDGYVLQKARIGTGAALVDVYDPDACAEDIRAMIDDAERELSESESMPDRDKLNVEIESLRDVLESCRESERGYVIQELYLADIDSERLCDLGMVTDARVYFAHSALRKLCALLSEER